MTFKIKQLLINASLLLGITAIQSGSAALANERSLILPNQASDNIVFALQNERVTIDPSETLKVFVGRQSACCTGKSPIAGGYSVDGNRVTFDPAFDFVGGQHYTVVTRYKDSDNNFIRHRKEFILQPANNATSPEVSMVYPSGPVLPENTLRFYIHFSTAMKPHLSADYIKLVDANGKADASAFMKFKQELWSEDRRRLTLLMDPGRIKRGVAQNLTLGPALLEGSAYSIVVDQGWPSASGKQKTARFEKTFSVTPALRTLPDTKLWTIEAPETSTLNSLIIKFDRPFDYQLAQSSIKVLDENGRVIQGVESIASNERTWRFKPTSHWEGASVKIAVDARLEDVAGNNFKDLLDHSIETDTKSLNQIIFTVELNSPG